MPENITGKNYDLRLGKSCRISRLEFLLSAETLNKQASSCFKNILTEFDVLLGLLLSRTTARCIHSEINFMSNMAVVIVF